MYGSHGVKYLLLGREPNLLDNHRKIIIFSLESMYIMSNVQDTHTFPFLGTVFCCGGGIENIKEASLSLSLRREKKKVLRRLLFSWARFFSWKKFSIFFEMSGRKEEKYIYVLPSKNIFCRWWTYLKILEMGSYEGAPRCREREEDYK